MLLKLVRFLKTPDEARFNCSSATVSENSNFQDPLLVILSLCFEPRKIASKCTQYGPVLNMFPSPVGI